MQLFGTEIVYFRQWLLHEGNADFKNILDDLGINHEKSMYQIATVLRKVVV